MSFTPAQIKELTKSSNDFVYFVNHIFSHSVKHFIKGEHVDNTARFLCSSKRTIRVSARHHFKSFSFYAYFMWKLMFEGSNNNLESHYFSFNADLAGYHVNKIKKCIEENPYFDDIIDRKPTAETVLKYTWNNKHFITLTPHGLVQFKRGIHAPLIFVDDPFQDPDNELNPLIIYKINEIFKSNIMDMPTEPDGELHVCGTPQTNEDFFFDKMVTARFRVQVLPAISKDPTTGEELYPLPWWVIFNVPTGGQYNVEINATGDVTPGTYQAKARAWTDYNAGTKASDLVDSSGNIVGALYNGGTGSVNPPILDEAVQTIVIGQAVVSATIDNFTITI